MATDDTRPLSSELGLDEDDTRPDAEATGTTTDPEVEDRPAAAAAATTDASATSTPTAGNPYATPVVYRTGPAPFAVFIGLVGLLVAGGVLVEEIADVSVPWGDLGPWSVVAGGLVVILVGVLGLRANRGED